MCLTVGKKHEKPYTWKIGQNRQMESVRRMKQVEIQIWKIQNLKWQIQGWD
jgi:hypothetical protein